ncbi:hypothetical protein Tco_0031812 [Tanacetum coccineum]
MSNQTNELKNMMASFFQMNTASSLGSRSLPSNTVANPRGGGTVTRGDKGYGAKRIGCNPQCTLKTSNPLLVECLALADLGASINLMPLSIWKKSTPELTPTQMIHELVRSDRNTVHPVIGEAVFLNRTRCHRRACEKLCSKTLVLGFSDSSTSGNPTPSLDPILSTSSPSLTPFEEGDFILEEIKACLTNDLIPPGSNDDDFDSEGDLLLLEKLLNNDPSSTLPPKELHVEELKIVKSLC